MVASYGQLKPMRLPELELPKEASAGVAAAEASGFLIQTLAVMMRAIGMNFQTTTCL